MPLIVMAQWLHDNVVRLFFTTGRFVELALPVKSARRVRIVDKGLGLDPGNGKDMSAYGLHKMRGKVLAPGRPDQDSTYTRNASASRT